MSRLGNDSAEPFDVVIVTPTYISSNPRVVKEADALADAGLRVCVVFSQGQFLDARMDDALVSTARPWSSHAISWSDEIPEERLTYWWSSTRFRVARRLPFAASGPLWLVERAECRTYPELARAAAAIPGRLYIGHYPEGLAAAAKAATRRKALLAYDVEDLHTAEDLPTRSGRQRSARVARIERRHIGHCAYVSAVSPGVARALATRYAIPMPLVVHNTFPWSDRSSIDGEIKDRNDSTLPSVYWFSQVIGLDRGLPDAIRALGRVRSAFQLHVRGYCYGNVAEQLRSLAREAGIADRLFIHGRVPPPELLSRTAEHDIGLALEQPISPNKALTVANKVFFYMLAGLAIVATATPGQEAILAESPDAGDLYQPGDHDALTHILERLLSDPALLARRRRAALAAAQHRWNWESEQGPLVTTVFRALGETPPASARARVGSEPAVAR